MTIAEKIAAAAAKVSTGTAPEVTTVNSTSLKTNAKSGKAVKK
jgi:hypothetical protein